MDSILTSIKKLLGIEADYEHFDDDIIMHINDVFSDLTDIGVGPSEGFLIKDATSVWSDFLPEGTPTVFEKVKRYIYLKVKLIFDPPSSSAVLESINKQIAETEFRLHINAEFYKAKEENQNGD
jgi:hypothetical protein